MVIMCPSGRNPNPPIIFENDDTFIGSPKRKTHSTLQRFKFRWIPKSEYFDSEAPNDDLDFRLKSYYNQHTHWWKSNAEALVQLETLNKTKRVLKNRPPRPVIIRPLPSQPFTIWTSSCRERLEHVSEAIDANHTQATNGGYSRKPDGNKFIA
ncbi:hypothetical protein KSF78_0009334 [Schistosoma japonicum]|nr:hypothetical protein KSF78_0009334 [Schistosoma japonicum]